MSMIDALVVQVSRDKWETKIGAASRCHIALIGESDGTFSAIVLNLPGAGSCGASEKEALTNVREAIVGVIESYHDDGEEIPWADPAEYEVPDEATEKWIIVNV